MSDIMRGTDWDISSAPLSPLLGRRWLFSGGGGMGVMP